MAPSETSSQPEYTPASSDTSGSQPSSDRSRPFRVIIVGAGVGGLVISHALTRAGIDHVVLEKGVVAPNWGASISIWANGARILHQIGCWDAIRAASLPLRMIYVRDRHGKSYSAEPYFDMMTERNGFEYVTMDRRDFLRIVYEQHPDKSRIEEGKRVVDAIDTENGISVKLDDGTVEEGDILIGCDGVHSTVRELLWRNANASIPDLITAKEKTSLETTYRALVGVAKPIPGMTTNDMHWITHWGLSFLILTQPEKTFFFVNWKLPQKLTWPSKAKWTDAEAEMAAASVANLPITDSVVFGELWKNRIRAHLIGLQEGLFDHWSFGRIVLVGDSAHKVTPNFALGAMCAMEGSAVLVNKIKDLTSGLEPGQRPPKQSIETMFREFQDERMPRQREASEASAFLTRLHAYDGYIKWFIMRWAIPLMGQVNIADTMGDLCSRAPKITFLPTEYIRSATYKWQDEPDHVPIQPTESTLARNLCFGKLKIPDPILLLFVAVLLYLISTSGLENAIMSTIAVKQPYDNLIRH